MRLQRNPTDLCLPLFSPARIRPRFASNLLLLPAVVAGLLLMFWFLVKGVDIEQQSPQKDY